MISDPKTEWIQFIGGNITLLGDNVYPTHSDVDQNADIFCVVEIHVLGGEKMLTGTMYHGYARIIFVATDPYTLDKLLLDKFGDELELKYTQFKTMTVLGINDVTEAEKYKQENETLKKRTVDVGMKWYKAE